MIRYRSLEADEGLLLKQLRLGALKDSPDAFSPTYEENSHHDDSYWLDSAKRAASAPGFELFIAESDGEPCGLVSASADNKSVGHIGAMWAAPHVRGKGVGKDLLRKAIQFLETENCNEIELTVTETNKVAIQLYERHGFTMTGDYEPLREGSTLKNLEMRRPVA